MEKIITATRELLNFIWVFLSPGIWFPVVVFASYLHKKLGILYCFIFCCWIETNYKLWFSFKQPLLGACQGNRKLVATRNHTNLSLRGSTWRARRSNPRRTWFWHLFIYQASANFSLCSFINYFSFCAIFRLLTTPLRFGHFITSFGGSRWERGKDFWCAHEAVKKARNFHFTQLIRRTTSPEGATHAPPLRV